MDLKNFFGEHKKIAVAFSGGADSAYLLYAAKKYGADVKAYFIKTAFQPERESRDAVRLASELGIPCETAELDILCCQEIARNTKDRCYFCKRAIMSTVKAHAAADGYDTVIEGTNASDDINDRPGFKALKELSVLSPLLLCSLTKPEIRRLSAKAKLFTADKPSYSCLATRIAGGEPITAEKLSAVEAAESALLKMGFSDLRVRLCGKNALLQFTADDLEAAFKKRRDIKNALDGYFDHISIDIDERKRSQ